MDSIEFDFVIVGAGSAGCVLAERLSACGRYRVAVVEAGGSDANFWIKMPLGYAMTFGDPAFNFNYRTEPAPGLNQRKGDWPRGRVLGGSSSVNAMAYARGLPHDYDDWADAGAQGWAWSQVKPAFEALETHCERDAKGRPQRRGHGPVWVSDHAASMHGFCEHFFAAGDELGWARLDDFNAITDDALSYMRSTTKANRRWSAADAFLRPAMARRNLRLFTQATALKLDFQAQRAKSVCVDQGGRRLQLCATQEIILSAGAINSPQLLQCSGLGDAAHLSALGIAPVLDLPQVGAGLQDHLALCYFYETREPTLNAVLGHRLGQWGAGLQYLLRRSGPLSVPINQVGGYVRSGAQQARPDLQIYCNPASYSTRPGAPPLIDKANGFLLCAQPCRPTSRGSVQIQSADPFEPPRIVSNALDSEADQQSAIAASLTLKRLAATEALRNVTTMARAPDVLKMEPQEMLAHFRQSASTNFHPSCSCRMGRDRADSVLDNRLRVHGIDGLRVVDASAFPNITSGNTNAPTLMLAARGAEMIMEDIR